MEELHHLGEFSREKSTFRYLKNNRLIILMAYDLYLIHYLLTSFSKTWRVHRKVANISERIIETTKTSLILQTYQ